MSIVAVVPRESPVRLHDRRFTEGAAQARRNRASCARPTPSRRSWAAWRHGEGPRAASAQPPRDPSLPPRLRARRRPGRAHPAIVPWMCHDAPLRHAKPEARPPARGGCARGRGRHLEQAGNLPPLLDHGGPPWPAAETEAPHSLQRHCTRENDCSGTAAVEALAFPAQRVRRLPDAWCVP